jgi:hypothetical protein
MSHFETGGECGVRTHGATFVTRFLSREVISSTHPTRHNLYYLKRGARDRNRTGMPLRARGFKPLVSTGFTTRAELGALRRVRTSDHWFFRPALYLLSYKGIIVAANSGACRGTRTPTPLPAPGPKPGASTNFAMHAYFGHTGAGRELRTPRPQLGRLSLCRLSYTRITCCRCRATARHNAETGSPGRLRTAITSKTHTPD